MHLRPDIVSDVGSELYVIEQFHDYQMVDGRYIME